jgi:hypothetical protein
MAKDDFRFTNQYGNWGEDGSINDHAEGDRDPTSDHAGEDDNAEESSSASEHVAQDTDRLHQEHQPSGSNQAEDNEAPTPNEFHFTS